MTEPERIPLSRPWLGEEELERVRAVLESGWLTTGPVSGELEEAFRTHVGARHAVAVASGTQALELALALLDPGPGDVIISPAYTFVSIAEVVLRTGAHLALVDIDPRDLNLSLASVEAALGRHGKAVRAVVPVHLAGHPADLAGLDALASRHEFKIIEDAAHAFPSKLGGTFIGGPRPGGQTTATCFSFYANKTMTTGEGGMITTESEEHAARLRRLRLHGLARATWDRVREDREAVQEVEAIEAGTKANLSDVAAAIGLAQLVRAERARELRASRVARYRRRLEHREDLLLPPDHPGSSWHLFIVRLAGKPGKDSRSRRDRLRGRLASRGIETSLHYRPLHLHRHYGRVLGVQPEELPHCLDAYRTAITLPLYPQMTDEQVDRVASELLEALDREKD